MRSGAGLCVRPWLRMRMAWSWFRVVCIVCLVFFPPFVVRHRVLLGGPINAFFSRRSAISLLLSSSVSCVAACHRLLSRFSCPYVFRIFFPFSRWCARPGPHAQYACPARGLSSPVLTFLCKVYQAVYDRHDPRIANVSVLSPFTDRPLARRRKTAFYAPEPISPGSLVCLDFAHQATSHSFLT